MKHLGLIVAAFAVAAVGVLILYLSRCATTVAIGAGSGFVLLGVALAIPAQLREAKGTLVDLAGALKEAVHEARP